MKVLIAGYLLGNGGIQSHLRWLAGALGEERIEVLVLSLGGSTNSLPDQQILKDLQQFKVQVIFCAPYGAENPCLSQLRRLAEITTIIQQFSPDVYLAVGVGWNLFIPPLIFRTKTFKTKTRLIFHEVMSGDPNGWHDPRWSVRWGFDEVVGQSPTVAKTFATRFGWKKTIPAIPAMPEPLELIATLPQPLIKRVELGKAKAALFSRLVPHKQAFWLVQQWESFKDILAELHIHGSGPEEALIREYVATQGLGDRIKCFGRYPGGQAYVDLLNSYDLTLLPTIGAEGAPLVLLESMACGVPFVAYDVGGIRDYGVNNPNILIVPPEEGTFTSAIKQMALKLDKKEINQLDLQHFYLKNYSYTSLKKTWLSYLHPSLE